MEFSITFVRLLFWGLSLVSPILMMLFLLIIALGLTAGRIESWKRADALYWAFITALTVGYGDIRPTRRPARLLAVLIAILGIMLTGIIVAITVEAASRAFEAHVALETGETHASP